MFFSKKTETDLGRRAEELKRRRGEIEGIHAQRRRLKAAAVQASEAHQLALSRIKRVVTDPMEFSVIENEELSALKKSVLETKRGSAASDSELAAHEEAHSDLDSGMQRLVDDEALLDQDVAREQYMTDVQKMVKLGSELEKLTANLVAQLKGAESRWPETKPIHDSRVIEKAAGLRDVTFPAGVFDVVPGDLANRTVWKHHVLRSVAQFSPDLLPPEHAGAVLEKIANDHTKGAPRLFARLGAWQLHPIKR